MSLSEQEIEQLSNSFIKKLEDSRTISDEKHRDHHRWIDLQIEKEQCRKAMWNRVKSTVIGALIVGAISGAASFLGWVAHFVVKSKGGS